MAYELDARFYAARRFDKIADTYLRAARSCYVYWGAVGKVKQLDSSYPQLKENEAAGGPAGQSRCLTLVGLPAGI